MDNKLIEQFYGKMDYNTFINIKRISYFYCIGHPGIGKIADCIQPNIGNILSFASLLPLAYITANIFGTNERYLKDVKQMRQIYDEVINNYNKINQTFDLKVPSEIATLYRLALFKGYLSKDKSFHYEETNDSDIEPLWGAYNMRGVGVCKHIASMLNDILVDYGINSDTLPVLTTQKFAIFANHLITIASYEGKSYILDPTNFTVGQINPNNSNIIIDSVGDSMRIKNSYINSSIAHVKKAREILAIDNAVISEAEVLGKALSLFVNNLDIFEKFYHENHEAYEEISAKLMETKPLIRKRVR